MKEFDILKTSNIKSNVLYLTCGELQPKLYRSVDNILTNLHGKWDKSLGGHKFPYDPTNAIEKVVRERKAPPKNETAFHPTPDSVLSYAIEGDRWLNHPSRRILEPSAGNGIAAKRLKSLYPLATLDLVEYFWLNADVLRGEGFTNIHEMDFLEYNPDEGYDFIFLNPPFTIKGMRDCYVEHVQHAMTLLKPNRSLVCIVNTNFLEGKSKKLEAFREWAFNRLEWLVITDEGEFSTTKIKTVVMKLHTDAIWLRPDGNFPTRSISMATLLIDNNRFLYEEIQSANERKRTKLSDYFFWMVNKEGLKSGVHIFLNKEAREFLTQHYLEHATGTVQQVLF